LRSNLAFGKGVAILRVCARRKLRKEDKASKLKKAGFLYFV
jgi:hypothetical protein